MRYKVGEIMVTFLLLLKENKLASILVALLLVAGLKFVSLQSEISVKDSSILELQTKNTQLTSDLTTSSNNYKTLKASTDKQNEELKKAKLISDQKKAHLQDALKEQEQKSVILRLENERLKSFKKTGNDCEDIKTLLSDLGE
jgi:uncharacterized protein (DUF4415 family)